MARSGKPEDGRSGPATMISGGARRFNGGSDLGRNREQVSAWGRYKAV